MSPHKKLHASDHINGTDDIPIATGIQKGLLSAADKNKIDTYVGPGTGSVIKVENDTYRTSFSTSLLSFQTYRTFTTSVVPTGVVCRVGWTYQWAGSSTSTSVNIQVVLDGTVIDTIIVSPRSSDDRNSNGGFVYFTTTTEQAHTISIQVATGSSGKVATIYQSDLEFYQIL